MRVMVIVMVRYDGGVVVTVIGDNRGEEDGER